MLPSKPAKGRTFPSEVALRSLGELWEIRHESTIYSGSEADQNEKNFLILKSTETFTILENVSGKSQSQCSPVRKNYNGMRLEIVKATMK